MSGDISRFWVTSPEFAFGRKLVVLAAAHDSECLRLRSKIARLEEELKVEKTRSRDLEEAARKTRTRPWEEVPVVGFAGAVPPSSRGEKVVELLRWREQPVCGHCRSCGGPLTEVTNACLANCQGESAPKTP